MDKDAEKLLERLAKDLKFCEESLKREARIDLVINVLDEIMLRVDEIDVEGLPTHLKSRAEEIASHARILFHRAVALSELKEREAMGE